MSWRIGIDPGCSGAVVVLQDDTVVAWALMPTIKVGSSTRVNGTALAAFLQPYRGSHAWLEQVHAMPGQGTTSMFTFGHAAGVAQGVIQALGIPCTLITPQVWKRRAGLIGKDKDAARSRAIQLWPQWRELDAKGRGQALADAALMARVG